MILQNWGAVLSQSFANLWVGFVSFVPALIIALIIFIVGWVVGASLSKVVEQVFKIIKVDTALKAAGVEDVTKKAGFELNSGKFVGELVRWFVVVAFLIASFEILGLTQVNDFLKGVVLGYLPNVIAAVLILMVAVVLADAVRKTVSAGISAAGVSSANLLGSIAKWAIWIVALFAALSQLGIAPAVLQTLFTGVVIALSLALGLSFGLGGQEAASRYIESVRHEISKK
ncbi:MAG: hypothetical protein WCO12_03870 [bacterium]